MAHTSFGLTCRCKQTDCFLKKKNKMDLGDQQQTMDLKIFDPLDMNSKDFNLDIYMTKLLKESRLSELMDTEQMLYRQIQTLDSEMQTLIYENYNKFISATDTVRKMSDHFDKMEHELNLLSQNMELITNKSGEIAKNLGGKREELDRMSTTHSLLNKVQIILELPDTMNTLINENNLIAAVDHYLKAKSALDMYSHFSSIKTIQFECTEMLDNIKEQLYQQLLNEEAETYQINESIQYLMKLNENPTNLCEVFFKMCEKKLNSILVEIKSQLESDGSNLPVMDILEFIDNVCNSFLSNLNQCIIFYSDVFLNKDKMKLKSSEHYSEIESRLKSFVDDRMEELFEIIMKRIKQEQKIPNNIIMFVRALDRFYKRVQKLNKIYSFTDFLQKGINIVYESTKDQCSFLFENMIAKYQEELSNLRHDIINDMSKTSTISRNATKATSLRESKNSLSETLIAFETTICENLKTVLSSLDPFLYPDLSFLNKDFKEKFVKNCVFNNIVVEYVKYILESAIEYEKSYTSSHIPSQLILILSKLCLDMSNSIIAYMVNFTEDIFNFPHLGKQFTNITAKEARKNAERLLNIYVWIEGQSISHMIRKSVETRDWMSTVEPRSVRSVMKRVIEDITLTDFHVGQLYEEGVRVERSSDSSRTFSTFNFRKTKSKSTWSYSTSSFDNNIISNIQKLFNDKIEIFGKVEFSKFSVVTGVIKIGLKTLIECVRLCTFSKFGFQQMQVDSYYLQIHLWKFASDEKIIVNLIDDVIISTKKRCLEPISMEKSVIENICENA